MWILWEGNVSCPPKKNCAMLMSEIGSLVHRWWGMWLTNIYKWVLLLAWLLGIYIPTS